MTFSKAQQRAHTGTPCSVAAFIGELAEKDPVEHDLFVGFLFEKNPRGWTHSGSAVFKKIREERRVHGYETVVSLQTINRHRSGSGCRCSMESS